MLFFHAAVTPAASNRFRGWMQICVELCGVQERCSSFTKENEYNFYDTVLKKQTPKNCNHFTFHA